MRILNRSAIERYGKLHAPAREALRTWFAEASHAVWHTPNDVKKQYPKASIIANSRVVFNIAGNQFRLIVSFNYKFLAAHIKFFGTHAQSAAVDAATVDESLK
jgi:mRNA interferase HigB